MTRYLAALAASSLLVACALPFPEPTPPPNRFEPALEPDHEEDLPAVSIDCVAGQPMSWCWVTTCADGMPGPDTPAIASARGLSIGAEVSEVGVAVQGADLGDSADVALNGTQIGSIPPGDWDYLVVFARFGVGRDAFYYWRLP